MQPQAPQSHQQPPQSAPTPQYVEAPAPEVNRPESRFMVALFGREVISALIVGMVVGLIVWSLLWVFDRGVFSPLMCKVASDKCAHSITYALVASQILAAIAGLIALVRVRAFRPLLVVIFVTIALWNVSLIVQNQPQWLSALLTMLMYGLGYALFMVLARMRALVLAALTMLIVLILVRLSIML